MKKIIALSSLVFCAELYPITTMMNRRLASSSPLLYRNMDYAKKEMSFEVQPWISGAFDPEHMMENIGIDGKSSMVLDQLGAGDINPENMLLAVPAAGRDYSSTMTLTPEIFTFGSLLHFYKQYEHVFFDIKTAVLNCKTIVNIAEAGGGDGQMLDFAGRAIYDAHDAFTQGDWSYGKFGDAQSLTGLDNIQLTIGSSTDMQSFSSDCCKTFIAGFALMEFPTGAGTKAEWLLEPQVGTNHWAFGFGSDVMLVGNHGWSLVAGGNYRYMLENWETRSFDLTTNGQWSRYLALDIIADISSTDNPEGVVPGLQGINLFTQDALIHGRNQITAYARLQKEFERCLFELSYNYLHTEKETITEIKTIAPGYGLYAMQTGGGVTTAHLTQINQASSTLDPILYPVELVTSDLNLVSGAATEWNSSTIAARLKTERGNCHYGLGASVDVAHSAQAISSWSVWANFELLM